MGEGLLKILDDLCFCMYQESLNLPIDYKCILNVYLSFQWNIF